jgi:hypothetical protein
VNTWNGGQQPFGPLKGVYDAVNQGGKLPDIGEHTDVLQLEPKFHIRSVRSRYHLNETTLNGLQTFYTQTTGKLDSVLALATAAQATATGGDKKLIDGFVKDATALKDGTALVKEVEAELKKLDPNMTVDVASVTALMPMKGGTNDPLTLEKKRVAIRIPAGTASGRRFRVRGQGIAKDGQRGDLIIEVQISVPEKLTEEQERMMREFAEAGGLKY